MKSRHRLQTLLVLPLLLATGTPVLADIYRYVDEEGRVILTDRPRHSGFKLLVRTWKGWEERRIDRRNFRHNQKRFGPVIEQVAREQGLPGALIHAVVTAESAYDPNAVSRAGAVGLMQLMPDTARRFGVSNRRDPLQNLKGGSRYLAELLRQFRNDLVLALAAYNAGENAVLRYNRQVPPFAETRKYVKRVLEYYRRYRQSM
ncbi:MAG: lytic transglycosylase domain-containing protein [Gammaproteobacteria bacterium]|nr:MAG: lytic transglycosylase domain-containing protein [Gammaproteobacteria bacterium]